MTEGEQQNGGIRAEAAEWVVREQSPAFSELDSQCLQKWRQQSPAHEAAYQFASRTWCEMSGLGKLAILLDNSVSAVDQPIVKEPGHRQSNSVYTIENSPQEASSASSQHQRRHHHLWLSAAASLLIVVFVGIWYSNSPTESASLSYHTRKGESLIIDLPDGSTANLNTESAIITRYNDRERLIELTAGEVIFTVASASDAEGHGRPFIVNAGNGNIRALGTEFSVQHSGDAVQVTVFEHSVEVTLPASDTLIPSVVLSAGKTVRYASDTGFGAVEEIDLSRAAAWRNGQLIFDHAPLQEVITQINRYRNEQIILRNRSLADRKVSGVFRIDDLDGALDTIALGMDADITTISSAVKAIQ